MLASSWALLRRAAPSMVVLFGLCACGDDSMPPGPVMCGESTCGAREVCDESAAPPRCECGPAYTGTRCEECAPGYEVLGDTCAPVVIDCRRDPCDNGECIRDPAGDSCRCIIGYAGPTCAQCALGYQDNDGDGTCMEGCDLAGDLGCVAPQVCNDRLGVAECACPAATTGDDCQACIAGYYRVGSGPCVPLCESVECSLDHQHCYDDGGTGGRCVCDAGWTGSECASCAVGFTLEGGDCVGPPSAGELLAIATVEGAGAVVTLNPMTGEATPVRSLPVPDDFTGWGSLMKDRVSGRLFATFSYCIPGECASGLIEVLPGGEVRRLRRTFSGTALLAPTGPTIHSLYADALTAEWTEAASAPPEPMTTLPSGLSVQGVAFEPATMQAQVLVWSPDLSWSLYRLDLTSGLATPLAVSADIQPEIAEIRPQQLSLFDGAAWTLAKRRLTSEERVGGYCRRIATALGYPGATDAILTAPIGDGGPSFEPTGTTFELRTQLTSGPEIVAFDAVVLPTASAGSAKQLEIHTTNPDAFLCIRSPSEGDLAIRFMSGVRPAGYIAARTNNDAETVEVAAGFQIPAATPSALAVWAFDAEWDPAFSDHPDLFRRMSDAERDSRRITETDGVDQPFESVLARWDGTRWTMTARLAQEVSALDDGDF